MSNEQERLIDIQIADGDWAEQLVLGRYVKASHELGQLADANLIILDLDERSIARTVTDIEWHWLQHLLFKHHSPELSVEQVATRENLRNHLLNLRHKNIDDE